MHHIVDYLLITTRFYLFCSLAYFQHADRRVESEPPENLHDINFEDLGQQQVRFEGRFP
jgi:hypothetical protein